MKIEEIIQEYQNDCQIDETSLDKESMRTIELHGKYLTELTNAKSKLKKLRIHRRKWKNLLRSYYKGELNNPEDLKELDREPFELVILKNEVDGYVDADDDMIQIDNKIASLEDKVDLLTEIIKNVNNRGYQIKTMLDWQRFINGLN